MNKYAKEYKQYYPKAFGVALLFIFMAGHLITRSDKPREDFLHRQGVISYLSHVHPLRPQSKPRQKDVYLIIKGYNRIFKMFIGTDKGDFSPRTNRLDELKIGDKINIYFEKNVKTKNQQVNTLLQYLDKDGELYYLRSKADKCIGYVILGSSGLLFMIGVYMKINSN